MPIKYNKVDKELVNKRAWTKLVETLGPGKCIFSVPDTIAVDSLQTIIIRLNADANNLLSYKIVADKMNCGVMIVVSNR